MVAALTVTATMGLRRFAAEPPAPDSVVDIVSGELGHAFAASTVDADGGIPVGDQALGQPGLARTRLTGSVLDQSTVSATPQLAVPAPSLDVAYGPLAQQRLNVYRPDGATRGTIVYFHSGGWAGNDRTFIPGMILSQIDRGFAVVSVEYRLTSQGAWAPDIMSDADRSVRFVKSRAAELGVDGERVVVAGGSAGGHIAALLASAPGRFVDPSLPAELYAVSPNVDGLIDLVGPSDLFTLWQAGYIAPGLQDALLRCTLDDVKATGALPKCDPALVETYSPLYQARAARSLPPAFFTYGGRDALVRADTQGWPMYQAWSNAAGASATWFAVSEQASHNLSEMNMSDLNAFLDQVTAR